MGLPPYYPPSYIWRHFKAGELDEAWENFKKKFGRKYPNEEEELKRKEIFLENYQAVLLHNHEYENNKRLYKRSINKFSDFTKHEMDIHCGLIPVVKKELTPEERQQKEYDKCIFKK